jgi:hypothetical protein
MDGAVVIALWIGIICIFVLVTILRGVAQWEQNNR